MDEKDANTMDNSGEYRLKKTEVCGQFSSRGESPQAASSFSEDQERGYTLENGVLRIFGTRKVTDGTGKRYGPTSEAPIRGVTTIIIDDGVEEIADWAFGNYVDLSTVILPTTLKKIGGSSFIHCSSLREISIPDSVEEIGFCAFQECTSLQRIVLPKRMRALHGSAFFMDSALSAITLPEGLTVIENGTFQNCTSLENVTVPEGVKTIESFAFAGSGVKKISLPRSLESVQSMAFDSAVKEVHVGNSGTKFSGTCGLSDDVELVGEGFKIPGAVNYLRIIAAVVICLITEVFAALLVALIAAAIYRNKKHISWGLFSGEYWRYLCKLVFFRRLKDRVIVC